MVHVKKVDIFGFKSFGFRNTTVHFEPGLVSISGPNGSGKSNILDAIIFAMGENRPKVMRVDKLRSLIHDIEGGRRGPKMARSSVHFDNTDRKIPVDSDIVEITRELTGDGDNIYYLNKKKTNRTHIMDLLDMANAGLGQLNAVQQGTVTRISEFSSEEKRKTIEDLIGLTSFDEKKTEAEKQLDQADRRLDVALATMGETKKRIDELESERNEKLRHELLGRELDRYRAMDAAGRLRTVSATRGSKESELKTITIDSTTLTKELEELQTEIEKLDAEKSAMMTDAELHANEEAQIKRDLSLTLKEYETDNSDIAVSKKRVETLGARIPEIQKDIEESMSGEQDMESGIKTAKESMTKVASKRSSLNDDARQINSRQQEILDAQTKSARKKSEIDSKIKLLESQLNGAKLGLSKAQGRQTGSEKLVQTNSAKLSDTENGITELAQLKTRLESMMKNSEASIAEIKSRIKKLQAKKTKAESDLDELELIRDKSSKAANQYESKIKTVKGFMHEDYTVAKLLEDADKLGIKGLVYQMLSWDARYERAVLAVSSDWLKAIVVQDFATLVSIAETAREKKLPKFKIIPLDAIPDLKLKTPKMTGVLGVLASHVECDSEYSALRTFLFGNVILAEDRESAHAVSKAGYKAVTLDGEYFEAKGGTVVIDINSKISKLTKLISMSSDIDGLFQSISVIKKYMLKKKNSLKKLENTIETYAERLTVSEKSLTSTGENHDHIGKKLDSAASIRNLLSERIGVLRADGEAAKSEILTHTSHIDSLSERISIMERNYASGEQDRIAAELAEINEKKTNADSLHMEISNQYRDKSAQLEDAEAEKSRHDSKLQALRAEENSARLEISELQEKITTLESQIEPKKAMLAKLREKEQELFSNSGYSVGSLKAVDDNLTVLNRKERDLSRQTSGMDRQSDSLKRDLDGLRESEAGLKKILGAFGFEKDMPTYDVSEMIAGLGAERESLSSLNANAPDKYAEVSYGYRSMSDRKNTLEGERNKIVRFIEGVEKDKKQHFLDAFDVVDKEVRLIFKKMTKGNAWLEIQDEDDIFNSGLSYMIQFPDKPKRESTSISGGEKTLAAIVFVLALQRLKPSPFYLFDEVDAHLDAPNSQKLANILEERSKESQFLMVSLKESVVQKAKLIYGVFSKHGSSHVVTYKDKRLALQATQGRADPA